MPDIRHTRLADVLINYSIKVKPKDRVAILTQPIAMPLVEEIYRKVLTAGGFPYVQLGGLRSKVETENLSYYLLTEGNQEQIEHVNQFEKIIREQFECLVAIGGSTNTRSMASLQISRSCGESVTPACSCCCQTPRMQTLLASPRLNKVSTRHWSR